MTWLKVKGKKHGQKLESTEFGAEVALEIKDFNSAAVLGVGLVISFLDSILTPTLTPDDAFIRPEVLSKFGFDYYAEVLPLQVSNFS